MNLKYTFQLAINNLSRAKLRTWLTILGIVIGVLAVVLIVSLSNALQSNIQNQLSGLGGNLIFLAPGAPKVSNNSGPPTGLPNGNLTQNDLNQITLVPNVQSAIGAVLSFGKLEYKTQSTTISVIGVDPLHYLEFNSESIEYGRMLGQNSRNEVVLGSTVAKSYFSQSIPLGAQITLNGKYYKVVGILAPVGTIGSDDSVILTDMDSARSLVNGFPTNDFSYISIKVIDQNQVNDTVNTITEKLLNFRHKTTQTQDFTIIAAQTILNSVNGIINGIAIFIALLSSISLLVGTVNIANTMFMTVLERTRQIGIYKALGATQSEISRLFLLESSILGLIGGIIGLTAGFAITSFASSLTNISITISIQMALIVLVFSTFIGAIAGFFPARRAAKLKPIDALRQNF